MATHYGAMTAFAGPTLDRRMEVVERAASSKAKDRHVWYMLTAGRGGASVDEAAVVPDESLTVIVYTGALEVGTRVMVDGKRFSVRAVVPAHNTKWPRHQYSAATLSQQQRRGRNG